MLNFMKGKKVQIFQSKFYLKVAKTVNNFHVILYFLSVVLLLLNLDLSHPKVIATHFFLAWYTVILLH